MKTNDLCNDLDSVPIKYKTKTNNPTSSSFNQNRHNSDVNIRLPRVNLTKDI